MRKFLAFLPVLLTLVIAAPQARAQLYAGAYGGFDIGLDGDATDAGAPGIFTMDFGFGFGAFAGGYVGQNMRIEGEIGYRANDLESFGGTLINGDVTSLAFMGNIYFDIPVQSVLTPYVGAGLGVADVEMTGFRTGKDTVLAAQVMVGATIATSPNVSLTFEYRLFGTDEPNIGNFEFEYLHSGILGGIRATF